MENNGSQAAAAPEKSKKVAEKKAKAKDKKNSFFAGVKNEFKKIIWPTRKDSLKQSVAVIVVAVVLGVLISMIDTAIKFGLGFLL